MKHSNSIVITLAISVYLLLCLGCCSAIGSGESGRLKFGLYIVRSPESTIAPIGDEVVLECGLSVNPDRIIWRFLPQNASKEHRRNFRIIDSDSVSNAPREAGRELRDRSPLPFYGQSSIGFMRLPQPAFSPSSSSSVREQLTKRFPLLADRLQHLIERPLIQFGHHSERTYGGRVPMYRLVRGLRFGFGDRPTDTRLHLFSVRSVQYGLGPFDWPLSALIVNSIGVPNRFN